MLKPYVVFCVDGYLPEYLDSELRKTFPDDIMLNRLGERLAVVVDLSENSEEFQEFRRASPVWNQYLQSWKSPLCLLELVEKFSEHWELRWYRPWRMLLRRRTRKLANLEVTVLLSVYRTGFKLTPHSDDKFKLLSLIHYLPHEDDISASSAGTTFFVPKSHTRRKHLRQFSEWSRGLRKYLPLWLAPTIEASLTRRYFQSDELNSEERVQFSKFFDTGLQIGYRRNQISGFIKNDWSMHEVDLCEFPEDALRRAVLINVRLRPSTVSRIIPKIEGLLMKLKTNRQYHSKSYSHQSNTYRG